MYSMCMLVLLLYVISVSNSTGIDLNEYVLQLIHSSKCLVKISGVLGLNGVSTSVR